jgi:general secretion pathway protein G
MHFSRTTHARPRPAFTLVEILIVVVILGILAAVVTPQFASATSEATKTITFDQLQRVRRAMAVYYVTNSARYPDVTAGNGTWGALVEPASNYLKKPPINDYVGGPNADVIILGTGADSSFRDTHGWIYDPATGNVWAAGFDAGDNPFPKP